MKNFRNISICLSILFCAAFACTPADDTESHFPACMTDNGKKIGIGGRKKIFVLDAETGEVIKTAETKNRKATAVCSADGEVFSVTGEEILEVETGKKYPRRIVDSTVIGINSANKLISYDGKKISGGDGRSLKLKIENPTDQTDDLKMFELTPENLDAVERNKKNYLIVPVKLLNKDKLLVFAGGKARTLPADIEADMFPDIWGFYKINLINGEIEKTRALDQSFDEVSLFRLPVTDSSKDGQIAAIAAGNSDGFVVYVFDTETGEIIFKKGYYERRKTDENNFDLSGINSLAISADKTKLAVAEDWYDGGRGRFKGEPIISIYDLKSTEKINDFAVTGRDSIILSFSGKDLIAYSEDEKSAAKFDTGNGKEIWNTNLEEN